MSRHVVGPDLGFTTNHIIESDTFAGIHAGDQVTVAEARFAGIRFEFVSHATHLLSGKQWANVWGGTRGHQYLQPVNPESLRKKS